MADRGDPLGRSMLARSAAIRLAFALVLVAGLWLAVLWAVLLP